MWMLLRIIENISEPNNLESRIIMDKRTMTVSEMPTQILYSRSVHNLQKHDRLEQFRTHAYTGAFLSSYCDQTSCYSVE